jgi:hypothetical protein
MARHWPRAAPFHGTASGLRGGREYKSDPSGRGVDPAIPVLKLESLSGAAWENPFGDGRSSERIADDLLQRMRTGGFARHRREDYHLDVDYSYRGDGQY